MNSTTIEVESDATLRMDLGRYLGTLALPTAVPEHPITIPIEHFRKSFRLIRLLTLALFNVLVYLCG